MRATHTTAGVGPRRTTAAVSGRPSPPLIYVAIFIFSCAFLFVVFQTSRLSSKRDNLAQHIPCFSRSCLEKSRVQAAQEAQEAQAASAVHREDETRPGLHENASEHPIGKNETESSSESESSSSGDALIFSQNTYPDLPWGDVTMFPWAKHPNPYHWDMKAAWQSKSMPTPKRMNFNKTFLYPPHPGCSLDKFMYVTAGYGQHNNQLIAMMNALALSKRLGRTLIFGDFIYMQRKDGKPSTFLKSHLYRPETYERRFLDPRLLYDLSGYWKDYCFVYRQDFFLQNPPPHGSHCYKPKKESIRMFDVVCTKKIHKRRQRGARMLLKAQPDTHRLLYFPEMYWYLPSNETRDYSKLRPSRLIQDEVERFQRDVIKTLDYTAVHLRTLEGGCPKMMASLLWAINATDEQRRAAPQQCEMSPEYISEAQQYFKRPRQPVFLATDEQDPTLDQRILNWGGFKYSHPKLPHSSLFVMAVDFWLMVEADIFVPNILSSVDWNVCAIRKARGRECYHFFTDPHVTP